MNMTVVTTAMLYFVLWNNDNNIVVAICQRVKMVKTQNISFIKNLDIELYLIIIICFKKISNFELIK